MSKEIYNKIKIENEIKKLTEDGKTMEEAISIVVSNNPGKLNYIIEAYLMPFDEINKDIERYDNSSSKLDELKFVNELCERYNVDRKAIIERIQSVRMINRIKSLETEEELEKLKYKREMLQNRRDINTTLSSKENRLYLMGLLGTTIGSLVLFYPESPLLVALITMAYSVGIPSIKADLSLHEDKKLVDELVNLDDEIEFIEESLEEKRLIKK